MTTDHYNDSTTRDGVHACNDSSCMTNGVPDSDLRHISFALNQLAPFLENTPIKTTIFKTENGLYCLLTVDYDENRAVIGAVYTPRLLEEMRATGVTLSLKEFEGGVN